MRLDSPASTCPNIKNTIDDEILKDLREKDIKGATNTANLIDEVPLTGQPKINSNAFFYAVYTNNVPMAGLLLSKGADIHSTPTIDFGNLSSESNELTIESSTRENISLGEGSIYNHTVNIYYNNVV